MHLIQAQKMQVLGQLVSSIAHDFNNLLTAIVGFSDLLLTKYTRTDPAFDDLMHIKQNSNRAINLVRQLLSFARKQNSEPAVIDITYTLEELYHLLKRLIGNNINLNMYNSMNLYPVKIDPVHLEQIIINLAGMLVMQ